MLVAPLHESVNFGFRLFVSVRRVNSILSTAVGHKNLANTRVEGSWGFSECHQVSSQSVQEMKRQ